MGQLSGSAAAGTSPALEQFFPVLLYLLAIVAFSYRQTIRAYPQGGGSYIVTKDNLGTWARQLQTWGFTNVPPAYLQLKQ